MRSPLKYWLEKHNWYLQFRYRPSTIFIWLKLRKSIAKNLSDQKEFYRSALENVKGKMVIDVGANEGFLTSIFNSLGFAVVAIEPSQRNFDILKTRFEKTPNVALVQAALSNRNEQGLFFESKKDYAVSTLSEKWRKIGNKKASEKLYKGSAVKIQTFTLDEVIKKFGVPGFIKIDVEGYEEKVLKGLTQPVPLISFEAILPYFMDETISCVEHLCSLCEDANFNYTAGNKFVYDQFISKEELIFSLRSLPPQTTEIFCRS
jgi:FkbM family methyltransferase